MAMESDHVWSLAEIFFGKFLMRVGKLGWKSPFGWPFVLMRWGNPAFFVLNGQFMNSM